MRRHLFSHLHQSFKLFCTSFNFTLLMIGFLITYICVQYNIDANYFVIMQDTLAYKFFSLAGIIGFVGPAIIGLAILILGIVRKDISIRVSAWMFTQASFLGWLLSSTMKVFTGRIQPPNEIIDNIIAVSHGFRFGFMEGGIYWGWPSSHTATAFAGCIALVVYYRDNVWLRYIALSYATYIAAGASMSFHWLSDVLVGIILGTGIGIAIGSSFQRKAKAKEIEKKDYR